MKKSRLSLIKASLILFTIVPVMIVGYFRPADLWAKNKPKGENAYEFCYITNWKINLRKAAGDDKQLIAEIPKSNFIMYLGKTKLGDGSTWLFVEWLTQKGQLKKGYIKYSGKAISAIDCPM